VIWGVKIKGKILEVTYFYRGKFWKIPIKPTMPSKMYTSNEIYDYLGPGSDLYCIKNITPYDLGMKRVIIEHAYTNKQFIFNDKECINF
jgi:hypothetical protein